MNPRRRSEILRPQATGGLVGFTQNRREKTVPPTGRHARGIDNNAAATFSCVTATNTSRGLTKQPSLHPPFHSNSRSATQRSYTFLYLLESIITSTFQRRVVRTARQEYYFQTHRVSTTSISQGYGRNYLSCQGCVRLSWCRAFPNLSVSL